MVVACKGVTAVVVAAAAAAAADGGQLARYRTVHWTACSPNTKLILQAM